jgi:hypothetical protein
MRIWPAKIGIIETVNQLEPKVQDFDNSQDQIFKPMINR